MSTHRSSLLCVLVALASVLLLNDAPAAQEPAKPYRILVTNDDGIRAPGIVALAQALQPLGEITVVAPSENQTGTGHSIITTDPILVDEVTMAGAVRAYSVVGPPATCVKVAVH